MHRVVARQDVVNQRRGLLYRQKTGQRSGLWPDLRQEHRLVLHQFLVVDSWPGVLKM
jgi:hypothetical protein